MSGIFWARTDQDEKAYEEVGQKTIVYLSMQFFGFYAPAHRGGICLLMTETGRTRTVGFVADAIKGFGKDF